MNKNIFKIFSLICLATACIDEMPNENPQTSVPGEAVQFIAGLDLAHTKTIYGAATSTAVKVNWVKDDMVSVYGTNVLESRNQGTYKVTAETGSAYAGELQMIGESGVQWGAGESDFYAVYPSTAGKFNTTEDGGVSVPMIINATQNNFFTLENGVWKGVPIDSENKETMTDAIMYAYAEDVSSGTPVNLTFKPFSTVLKFTLNGVGTTSGKSKVYINEIQVTAKSPIAGTFSLNINGHSASAKTADAADASNTVKIKLNSKSVNQDGKEEIVNNILVGPDENIEFNVFTIPQSNVAISSWQIKLITSHGTKTFTIANTVTSTLTAGQIHNVNIEPLDNLEDDFTFNPEEWIAQLPTDILLSELSIPGAWYSTNGEVNDAGVGYQNSSATTINGVTVRNTNLSEQYAHGIRAFNIDARLTIPAGYDSDSFGNTYSMSNYEDGNLLLVCAGTEKEEVTERWLVGDEPSGVMSAIGKTVKGALIELGELITSDSNKDEFIVVVITIAEKAKTNNYIFGPKTYGTVDSKMMLRAIADVLNDAEVKGYLYDDHITERTTINQVLGKIIVKVNINDANFYANNEVNSAYTSYKAPMMITYGQMSTDYVQNPMVCGLDYKVNNNLPYIACQAQSTSNSGFRSRQTAITAVAQIAYDNYIPNQNDDPNDKKVYAWYQLGIGGASSAREKDADEYTYVVDQLNPHVLQIIQTRLDSKIYAPVGIVLMNQVTHAKSVALTNAILTLNARMRLEALK